MESENVALVRRVYDLFDHLTPARDRQAVAELLGLFDEDVEYVRGDGPDAATHRGRDAMQAAYADWLDTVGEHRVTIEEARASGDRVLVATRDRVSPRAGMEVENRGWGVFTVREGRVVRFATYASHESAIDAFERS